MLVGQALPDEVLERPDQFVNWDSVRQSLTYETLPTQSQAKACFASPLSTQLVYSAFSVNHSAMHESRLQMAA